MGEVFDVRVVDGVVIKAEVAALSGVGSNGDSDMGGDAGARKILEHAAQNAVLGLEQARACIRAMGDWAAQTISQQIPGRPDSFELEFGLKLAVQSGQLVSVVAGVSGEASLVVRLGWDRSLERAGAQPTTAPPAALGTATPSAS
jgi:hypothetical protein